MNDLKRKAMFAKLKSKGITTSIRPYSEEEQQEYKDDGNDEKGYHYTFKPTEQQTLSGINGKRSAGEIVDHLTGTTENERMSANVWAEMPLHSLMKMGKIKHIDGKWKLANNE